MWFYGLIFAKDTCLRFFFLLRTKTTVKQNNLSTENCIVNKIAFVGEKPHILCNHQNLTKSFLNVTFFAA